MKVVGEKPGAGVAKVTPFPSNEPPPQPPQTACDVKDAGIHDFEVVSSDTHPNMVYRFCKKCYLSIGTNLLDLTPPPRP